MFLFSVYRAECWQKFKILLAFWWKLFRKGWLHLRKPGCKWIAIFFSDKKKIRDLRELNFYRFFNIWFCCLVLRSTLIIGKLQIATLYHNFFPPPCLCLPAKESSRISLKYNTGDFYSEAANHEKGIKLQSGQIYESTGTFRENLRFEIIASQDVLDRTRRAQQYAEAFFRGFSIFTKLSRNIRINS